MKVTIEVGLIWVRLVRSPIYYIVAAFTGVSVSFAPFFLYMASIGRFSFGLAEKTLCLLIIVLVPPFYMRLGALVVRELLKKNSN